MSGFANIIGQERVKNFFERALSSRRISHAYLFLGPAGVGKEAMALELAKALLGAGATSDNTNHDAKRIANLSHPDVRLIFPAPAKLSEEDYTKVIQSVVADPYNRIHPWANPSISIEKIRELRRQAGYKSFEGKGQVFIILDCDRLTTEASNSLLKILEEPPENMYLVMTSSRPSLLLPTITSRCQQVKFDPLTAEEIEQALLNRHGIAEQRARLCARLAGGSYRRALELVEDGLQERREQSLEFFRKTIQNNFLQVCYVDELLSQFQRDARAVRELLTYVLIWFRDAMVYRETGEAGRQHLILQDQAEILKNFTEHFPEANLNAATQEIENSLQLMDRNVQINLILIVLLNKLRAFVRR